MVTDRQLTLERILAVTQSGTGFDRAVAICEGAFAGFALAHGVLVQRRFLDKLVQCLSGHP
jgi:hypothetical protein